MTKQIIFAGIIWYLMFTLTHAFLSDGFQGCLRYFYENEAPQLFEGIKDTDRCVCQEYANSVHFATFYDALRKIPHYSAYKLPDDEHNYDNKPRLWRTGKDLILGQQATLEDYNEVGVNELSRGHLAPRSYFNTKRAADVLLNIAPQYKTFNQKSWNYLEESLHRASTVRCGNGRTFFITGVIPSDNNLWNQKINIPSHFWTAICCDTSNLNIENRFNGWSFAYIVANVNPENRVIGMFTVEDFVKDVRLGKRYRKIFTDITIGNRIVKNCLFDPNQADEVIQQIVENYPAYRFMRPIPPPNVPVDRVRSKSI